MENGDVVMYRGHKVTLSNKELSSAFTAPERYLFSVTPELPEETGLSWGSRMCAYEDECTPLDGVKPVAPCNGETGTKLNVCQEADQIAGQGGDRMRDYGHPLDNHARIAAGWSVLLGITVTPSQAALCMMWIKLAREMNTYKRDNMVDLCGYAKCYEMIKDEEARRAQVKSC